MERKAFPLRIDPELWAELEAWAQSELRSVNGQIEYILRQAVLKRRGEEAKREAAEKTGTGKESGRPRRKL